MSIIPSVKHIICASENIPGKPGFQIVAYSTDIDDKYKEIIHLQSSLQASAPSDSAWIDVHKHFTIGDKYSCIIKILNGGKDFSGRSPTEFSQCYLLDKKIYNKFGNNIFSLYDDKSLFDVDYSYRNQDINSGNIAIIPELSINKFEKFFEVRENINIIEYLDALSILDFFIRNKYSKITIPFSSSQDRIVTVSKFIQLLPPSLRSQISFSTLVANDSLAIFDINFIPIGSSEKYKWPLIVDFKKIDIKNSSSNYINLILMMQEDETIDISKIHDELESISNNNITKKDLEAFSIILYISKGIQLNTKSFTQFKKYIISLNNEKELLSFINNLKISQNKLKKPILNLLEFYVLLYQENFSGFEEKFEKFIEKKKISFLKLLLENMKTYDNQYFIKKLEHKSNKLICNCPHCNALTFKIMDFCLYCTKKLEYKKVRITRKKQMSFNGFNIINNYIDVFFNNLKSAGIILSIIGLFLILMNLIWDSIQQGKLSIPVFGEIQIILFPISLDILLFGIIIWIISKRNEMENQ